MDNAARAVQFAELVVSALDRTKQKTIMHVCQTEGWTPVKAGINLLDAAPMMVMAGSRPDIRPAIFQVTMAVAVAAFHSGQYVLDQKPVKGKLPNAERVNQLIKELSDVVFKNE